MRASPWGATEREPAFSESQGEHGSESDQREPCQECTLNVSFLNQRLVLRLLSGQLISLQEPVLLGHVKEFQGDFQGLFSCADQAQRKKKIGHDSVLWLHQAHPLAELDFQRLGQLLRVVGLSFKVNVGAGPSIGMIR